MRNEAFSIFRFLFAILIVGYHFAPSSMKDSLLFFDSGQQAVTFFFVLSGFFVTGNPNPKGSSLSVIRRKFFALAPLYYSVLVLCITIELVNGRFPIETIFWDLLLLQAWVPGEQILINGPAWFMSALLSCMGIYIFLIRKVFDRSSPTLLFGYCSTFWILSQVTSWVAIRNGWEHSLYYLTYFPPVHLSSFLWGVVIARIYANAGRPHLTPIASAALLVTSLGLSVFVLMSSHRLPSDIQRLTDLGLLSPLFSLLIASIALLPRRALSLIDVRFVRFLGAISFPIYLLQVPVFKIVERSIFSGFLLVPHQYLFEVFLVILLIVSSLWLPFQPSLTRVMARLNKDALNFGRRLCIR